MLPRLATFSTVALPLLMATSCDLLGQRSDVRQTYAEFCASCHGARMEGTATAPSMLDDTWTYGSDDDTLARVIRDGVPDKGMPGFGTALSNPQIRALVVYIHETRVDYERRPDTLPSPPPDHVFKTAEHSFRVEVVTDGVSTPWGMAWLPDGRMLVTEKSGDLRVIEKDGTLLRRAVSGTPRVDSGGQGGLMEVAPHPDFASNGWIYLSFSHPAGGASMTKVVRGRIREHAWVDEETIFEAPRELYRPLGGVHFGSRLAFDGRGYLFFSIGERGAGHQAQDLTRPNGKVHRLFDDGRVPPDNPFVNEPNAIKSIWTFGNRNPQGLDFDSRTGVLWETEHGPRGGDELNVIKRGLNYGWPEVTYGMNYNGTPITDVTAREGVEPPVIHWTPSIAVCGIDFYEGDRFPKWKGNLLVSALAQQHVRRVVIENEKVTHQEVIYSGFGRVRDVASGPDGYIYLALN
ncbi:MAG TPA: PQQ-dependent sugar dehydrogenase, partial [Candidatus Synoicihabitans sp.]|nr:PQQ-dependent sugar dehydrogenase [Candidatus Synoicihabitans sp.]